MGFGTPNHDVDIGYRDGFSDSHHGPDIHQDYWGQLGGGDMPAMGAARPGGNQRENQTIPAGVTIYHPKLWDGRRGGDVDPQEEHLTILTVNVTYLSPRVRKWLGSLPYDIIMIQEHHKHSLQSMGKIQGYSMIFSPAHVTHVKKRRKGKGNVYHTKGGAAILYRPRLTRFLQPGVDTVGHNWCSLIIKLAKNRVRSLVTSYIPHGTTQDGTRTIVEVNKYLDLYKVPYIYGEVTSTDPRRNSLNKARDRGATTVWPRLMTPHVLGAEGLTILSQTEPGSTFMRDAQPYQAKSAHILQSS